MANKDEPEAIEASNNKEETTSTSFANGGTIHKCLSENERISDDASSHVSKSSRSAVSLNTNSTKVYYHIDDEPTPYCTEVPVPFDRITLDSLVLSADFKAVLNRTNFKFYCKANDPEVGGEVKAEIRDDSQPLCKSSNGQFELFLLTAEGSSHSDGTSSISLSKRAAVKRLVPAPAPLYPVSNNQFKPHYHLEHRFGAGHRRKPFEDSTIYTTETEGRGMFSDDESRVSTSTDNITSVSRQHYNMYRRRRRQFHRNPKRQLSRASSLSSMTETSMALEVITVTLNMDTVNFLGISIVGQSCSRGDNGIYVANVMPGGAVALDGRIEPGDMILQVNEISFENFKNDQAVEVLKRVVNTRGPIKLTVAKSFDAGRANYFSVPLREPVRPIDTHAWVQHTNAIRGVTSTLVNAMNAIPEGSEGAPTPIPGQYPPQKGPSAPAYTFSAQNQQRPASSSTTGTSNGSGGAPQTIVGPGGVLLAMQPRLSIHGDKRKVMHAMALPNSGLDIRDRTWLKIPIPMSFLGSALIDWLMENVDGLRDRKEAKKYAADLLKARLIAHVVNKSTFTEQCYYIFGEDCSDLACLRTAANGENVVNVQQQLQQMNMGVGSGMAHPNRAQMPYQGNFGVSGASMISEYASMPPISPYPAVNLAQINYQSHQRQPSQQIYGSGNHLQRVVVPEQFGTTSQASNNSNEESSGSEQRRKAILPPAPSLTSIVPSNPAFPHQQQYMPNHQQQQQYSGQNMQSLLPSVAPPTPKGESDHSHPNRTQTGAVGNTPARIRLSENFPEVFVEHF